MDRLPSNLVTRIITNNKLHQIQRNRIPESISTERMAPSKKTTTAVAPKQPVVEEVTGTVPVPVTMTATDVQPTPFFELKESTPQVEKGGEADEEKDPGQHSKLRIPASKLKRWRTVAEEASHATTVTSSLRKSLVSITSAMETFLSGKKTTNNKTNNRPLSDYNIFVQQNIKSVAQQNPGLSNKDVMTLIAELWRNQKKTETTVQAS